MNKTQELHNLGQSLWLDNITREILDNGTLRRYMNEFSITGLTSNPTIFDEAIGNTDAYDDGIRDKAKAGKSGEALFMELALEDLRRAADLFRPVFDATDGVDGWVSMEVSPLLANDTSGSIDAAARIHRQARTAQSVRQDSGHARRRSGDRGIDLRRGADQRDPVVLARAIHRRGRSLSSRHRTAHRCRPRPARRIGGLAVREPVGQGGRRQGAARVAQSARHRDRRAHLPRVSRAARIAALAQARRGRRTSAAPALGQHRNQGSRRRRTPCTSRRWRRPTRSTPFPKRRCVPSPSTASSRV